MQLTEITVGTQLRSNDWLIISQAMIQQFADTTGDHQWIHLDTTRCMRDSPFKTTIAHGFLTASLLPREFANVVSIDETTQTVINYGVDKLRFLEPVRSGDRIRFNFTLADTVQKDTGLLFRFAVNVEIEGRANPALVGEFLMLLLQS